MNTLMLRIQLWLIARGALFCGAALLCLVSLALVAWMLPQRGRNDAQHAIALALIRTPPKVVTSAPVLANQNLLAFYGALGEQRYAEQQVKTLFGLAAKNGLILSQGEYKSAAVPAARLHTYQITLPVKGSYKAIWQFSLAALRAMPFASLDDISFKRDTIGDASVEARLRLTLYLADGGTP